jgi:hypothetical protein
MWFEPVAPNYQPALELVDRELESYEADGEKIKFTFDSDGYQFAYYTLAVEGAGQPHLVDALSNAHAANAYERLVESDIQNERSDVTNPTFIRQKYIHALVKQFARRYFEEHLSLPDSPRDLISGYWEPRGEVFSSLPTYGQDQANWVYVGIGSADENDVLYIEIVRPDGSVINEQWIYRSSTQDNTTSVRESRLTDDQSIERDATEPFIDASQQGWGMI